MVLVEVMVSVKNQLYSLLNFQLQGIYLFKIITLKTQLETLTSNGYNLIAKTRYVRGSQAVSTLQVGYYIAIFTKQQSTDDF